MAHLHQNKTLKQDLDKMMQAAEKSKSDHGTAVLFYFTLFAYTKRENIFVCYKYVREIVKTGVYTVNQAQ